MHFCSAANQVLPTFHSLDETCDSAWLADDELPATLMPILRATFEEFGAQVAGIASQVSALAAHWPRDKRLPRILEDVSISLPEGIFRRAAMPYTLWMAQCAIDTITSLLADAGGEALLSINAPRLERDGLQARFSSATHSHGTAHAV